MRTIWIVLILFCSIEATSVFAQDPIVYSRCVRTTAEMDLTGDVTINGEVRTVTRRMRGLDIYDVLPDVTNFFGNFTAPCDLVFRQSDGTEKIIYNCSAISTDENACAALDPAVSFDGKSIIFSVFRGTLKNITENIHAQVLDPEANNTYIGRRKLPNKILKSKGAHLHLFDIDTEALANMPFKEGIFDSGPTFMSNQRVAFTSNRDGNTSTLVWRSTASRMGSRIWTIGVDGQNLDLASHHSLSREEGPFMLKDGRLAYSSWQIFGGLPFRHSNGSVGGFTTLDNLFHIYVQSPDGAGNFPLYGQHSGDHRPSSFGASHNATHFITQTSDERVWFADYYRANNKGLGKIIGVMPEPKGQEGINPYEAKTYTDMYVPRDAVDFASWAINGDTASKNMPKPDLIHANYKDPLPWAGKVGHPAALTENGLMLSWGKGACSTVGHFNVFYKLGFEKPFPPLTSGSGGGVPMNIVTTTGLDTPGCDVGVYRATKIPSEHPSDLEMIVDSPDWHEIMARAVVPYSTIYGVEKPEIIESADKLVAHPALPRGTPFGLLGAASITDRETHPRDGIKFVGEHQFNLQGTDTINYDDEDLCGIRMLGVMPNRSRNAYREIANIAGERLAILGEIPVKHTDSKGNRIIDASGHPDTSFLLSMPANMPYLMQGIDCEGRTLNTDQIWQALRPGEMKTCGGCHVHSKPARLSFDQSFAARPEYQIPELGRGTVPLIDGSSVPGYGVQLEFTRDIKPIFDEHCVSCHAGENPAAGLSLDKTGTKNNVKGTTWWRLVADYKNEYSGGGKWLRRPQLTKYIRAFNALGSLLYWKAANQRTDRFTDSDRDNDIDFGQNHPTNITKQQLWILSRWIDLGNPGGEKELLDTQKPTVHLAANIENENIKSLLIGTTDLGSGINVNNAIVKVGDTPMPVTLKPNGIAELDVPISDPATQIEVSVSDIEGNVTTVNRTAGFLIDTKTRAAPNLLIGSTAAKDNRESKSEIEFKPASKPKKISGINNLSEGELIGTLPDINVDEEQSIIVPINVRPGARVFLEGYPPGSIFNEVKRELSLRPDFTQGGRDYVTRVMVIDGNERKESSFVIKVANNIAPPDPVVTRIEPVWKAKIHHIELTSDDFLDPPKKAGTVYKLGVFVPDAASDSNKLHVRIQLHGSGGGANNTGSAGSGRGGFSFGPPDPTLSKHTGQHSDYPDAATDQSIYSPTAQRRILHILDWMTRTFPGVDRNRVKMVGASMGASGAVYFAAMYPYHIVSAGGGSGNTNQYNFNSYSRGIVTKYWGNEDGQVKDDRGLSPWDRYDMTRALRDDPNTKNVFFHTKHGTQDKLATFGVATQPSPKTGISWYKALQDYGIGHRVFWDASGHGNRDPGVKPFWEGSLSKKSTLYLNKAFPAFSHSSIDDVAPLYTPEDGLMDGDTRGGYNRHLAWVTAGIIDEHDRFEIPLFAVSRKLNDGEDPNETTIGEGYTGQLPITVDVTLRRIQRFHGLSGEIINWQFGQQGGKITVGNEGDIKIPQLNLESTQKRLILTREWQSKNLPLLPLGKIGRSTSKVSR